MKNYSKFIALFAILIMGTYSTSSAVVSSSEVSTPAAETYVEQKTIEKTFVVDASHQLKIDNRYGKVQLSNWDNNQIKVVVTVRTEESSRQRAKETLDRVEISHSTQGQVISFETRIEPRSESWWSSLTNSGSRSLSIDYDIYLPKYTGITIKNSYGETIIPDRDGRVDLTVKYGSLNAKNLNSNSNKLYISYSKATIQTLDEGVIEIKYGNMALGAAKALDLDMSYCSGSSIGQVRESLSASLRYSGNFEVGLGKTIRKANIRGSYSGMQVLPDKDAKLDFDVSVSYGSFKYTNDRAKISNHNERSRTSSSYSGTWNGGGQGVVNISSSYGSVTLK